MIPYVEQVFPLDDQDIDAYFRKMPRRKVLKPLSPLANPGTVLALDKRSAEARLVRRTEELLAAQLGGNPTAAETLLIRKAAVLNMRFEVLHRAYCETGASSAHADKFLISLATVCSGILLKLGLDARKPSEMTLEHYVAMKVANR